jgi:16S rRNA (guanine(966)-N(2))-methyltransferase RsmD
MDQMRESVFATLGDISGAHFLDLFAGSGSIGIEAASRGATRVVFVESDRKKIAVLRENVAIIESAPGPPAAEGGATPVTRVVSGPVERFLTSHSESETVDYVFADPPFPYRHREKVLGLLGASDLIRPEGLVLMHYPVESPLPAARQEVRPINGFLLSAHRGFLRIRDLLPSSPYDRIIIDDR